MKLLQKVKNWFSTFRKYSNNFPFLAILDFSRELPSAQLKGIGDELLLSK